MRVELKLATPELEISERAKICYGTKSVEDGGKDITSTLVHMHKHLAALRFAYMTIYVEDISVACQNQIVRSSHLDFMVQSKRYVNPKKGGFKFIMPEGLEPRQIQYMKTHWEDSLNLYTHLLNDGVKKEDARAILPANTSTSMNITGNLQGWDSAFKLRLNPHAQTEVRQVFIAIWAIASKQYPQVFTDTLFLKYTKEN